jgi:hypothetical protein
MTGGVYVNVPRLRREIALRGWRPTDLARVARLSAGTMTTIMKGGAVSPGTVRKIATALKDTPVIPGLEALLDEHPQQAAQAITDVASQGLSAECRGPRSRVRLE